MEMLKKLAEYKVVDFELVENKTALNVTEACDYYYYLKLSKVEVEQLIKELTDLCNQMRSSK